MTTSWSMSRVFTAGLPRCETPGRAVESSEWTVASSFGGRLSRRASARCELRGGGVSSRMPRVAIADLSCDAAKGALRETLAHRFDGCRFLGREIAMVARGPIGYNEASCQPRKKAEGEVLRVELPPVGKRFFWRRFRSRTAPRSKLSSPRSRSSCNAWTKCVEN